MPLPTLLMPPSVPDFLIAGHASQWEPPFGDLPMTTGHRRKRRKWTRSEQTVAVSLFLERDQMADFHGWHRGSLKSGERQFAARVKEQGFGMLWYSAFFVGMYEAEALHLGRWRVSANLFLSGDGEVNAPNVSALSVDFSIPFVGRGSPSVGKRLSVDFSINFTPNEES